MVDKGIGKVKCEKPSEFNNSRFSSRERFDLTMAPNVDGSITYAATVNKVYIFALNEIVSMYDESDAVSAEEFMENISNRRKNLDAQ